MDLSSLASTLVAMMGNSPHMQIDVRESSVRKPKFRISLRCSDTDVLSIELMRHTIRPHMPIGDLHSPGTNIHLEGGRFMDQLGVNKDH